MKSIKVWAWDDAPAKYRKYSTHGGDEDGVILIPIGVAQPYWLEKLWITYGVSPDFKETKEGTVIIWAHS
jgi:hypothetical protein